MTSRQVFVMRNIARSFTRRASGEIFNAVLRNHEPNEGLQMAVLHILLHINGSFHCR